MPSMRAEPATGCCPACGEGFGRLLSAPALAAHDRRKALTRKQRCHEMKATSERSDSLDGIENAIMGPAMWDLSGQHPAQSWRRP
jgi:hypothetical protein